MKIKILTAVVSSFFILHSTYAFEGRITAAITQGGPVTGLIYTAGTNDLRIEQTNTDWPRARDIVNLQTGEITLLFPNNRSFVRLSPAAENSSPTPPGFPQPPGMPAMPNTPAPQAIGPTNLPGAPAPPQMPAMPNTPAGFGPQSAPGANTMPAMPGMPPGMPAMSPPGMGMPAMPMMMPPMMGKMELRDTGHSTNLLGFACEQYELKRRGEMMEIWATDQLLPFQPYLPNQPHHFGPRMIEEQWGEMLKAIKLFPLLAVLKFDNGAERYRFEVQSVTPEQIKPGEEAQLFQPPPDYQEIQPLPF